MHRSAWGRTIPIAAIALAAVLAACDVTGSDADVEGRYVLRSVNSLPVPATVLTSQDPDGTEWSFRVVAGGMEFDGGRYVMSIVSEAYQDGQLAHTGQDTWTGSYTTRRSRVTLVADATGATGTGRVDGQDVRFTIATLELGDLTLVFRREG
jgi:uncharacterized membrane protein